MREELRPYFDRYLTLERSVGERMRRWCGPHCGGCQTVCCRPEICAESESGIALRLLRSHAGIDLDPDPKRGWLGSTGCRLPLARPPLCYEFLCAGLAEALDPIRLYALRVLGQAINRAGRRVLGRRHLVELRTPEEVERLRPQTLMNRLRDAEEAVAAALPLADADDPATVWAVLERPAREAMRRMVRRQPDD